MAAKKKSKSKKGGRLRRLGRRVKGAVQHHIVPTLFMGVGTARVFVTPPSRMNGQGSQSVLQVLTDETQSFGDKAMNALDAIGENLMDPLVYTPIAIGAVAAYGSSKFHLGRYTRVSKKVSVL